MTPLHQVIINKNTKINPIWIMRQAGRYLPEFREIRKENQDFIKLCLELHKLCSCRFILHCDKNDYEKCLNIKNKVTNLDMDIIKPTNQLIQMFSNINECDLFISGSTGPLHVAGSLNKKTVGFYPSKKSSTSLRWRTINEESNKLSFGDFETDNKYIKVNINSVAAKIYNKLLK